ncbi:MAG: heavy-metal-associated domain-containing protein [Clostridiales bacterium]|nr:heavy-metal-associated domain-containing protein [Clostridiales bacterium]
MKTIVYIDGMCCDRCAKRVEEKLSVAKNVISVDVKFKKKIAVIRSREEVSKEEIEQIIADAGYTFLSIEQK